MDTADDVMRQKVTSHGWAVVRVEGSTAEPNYAYSIGLFQNFKHPEVIAFGLSPDILQSMINAVGEEVRRGARFDPPAVSHDVLEGYDCAFREVAPAAVRAYMGAGTRYYDRDFPAIHCIWPDRDGRFPWQPGAPADFRRMQPMPSDGPEPSTRIRP